MKRINLFYLAMMAGAMLLFTGCSDDNNGAGGADDLKPIKIEYTRVTQTDYAQRSNKFANNLLSALAAMPDYKDKNMCVSPISMQYLLSMIANGANKAGCDEIVKALGMTDIESLNNSNKELIGCLEQDRQYVQIVLGNSVWTQKGYGLKDEFVSKMNDYYDAQVDELDFSNDAQGAKNTITQWAAKKTNNIINRLSLEMGKDTKLVLANATYFNAKWSRPFDTEDTSLGTFENLNGTKSSVMLMRKELTLNRYEDETLEAAEMSYGKGYFSLMVLMPKNSADIDNLCANADWWTIRTQMEPVESRLAFPRFKTTCNWRDVISACPALGIKDIEAIPMTEMLEIDGLAVEQITQDLTIEFKENGTSAAVVSGGSIGDGAITLHPMINFTKPFVYAIRENTTGTILFMGKVVGF